MRYFNGFVIMLWFSLFWLSQSPAEEGSFMYSVFYETEDILEEIPGVGAMFREKIEGEKIDGEDLSAFYFGDYRRAHEYLDLTIPIFGWVLALMNIAFYAGNGGLGRLANAGFTKLSEAKAFVTRRWRAKKEIQRLEEATLEES